MSKALSELIMKTIFELGAHIGQAALEQVLQAITDGDSIEDIVKEYQKIELKARRIAHDTV